MIKISIIKKLKNGKYRLYSRKKNPKTHKRRNLGTFDSLSAAKKHERSIQFFKRHNDDGLTNDKETKILTDLSNIAEFLENAGFIDEADKVYNTMYLIDPSLSDEDYLIDPFFMPEGQLNFESAGYTGGEGPISNNYSTFSFPEAFADDMKRMFPPLDGETSEEAARFNREFLQKLKQKQEDNNIDMLARSNGLSGSSLLNNGGFAGLSDSFFYQSYENLEPPYK